MHPHGRGAADVAAPGRDPREADLPLRLMAYTPCYRREAGSAGRDTRGLLRAHEFDKVEILAYATPEQAPDLLAEILRPRRGDHRRARACLPDHRHLHRRHGPLRGQTSTSRSTRPACDSWLEVVRCPGSATTRPAAPTSATGRRGKGTQIVHTLNGSALAVPRVWAAIVENYRQPDGTVRIPDLLLPYMRGSEFIS